MADAVFQAVRAAAPSELSLEMAMRMPDGCWMAVPGVCSVTMPTRTAREVLKLLGYDSRSALAKPPTLEQFEAALASYVQKIAAIDERAVLRLRSGAGLLLADNENAVPAAINLLVKLCSAGLVRRATHLCIL